MLHFSTQTLTAFLKSPLTVMAAIDYLNLKFPYLFSNFSLLLFCIYDNFIVKRKKLSTWIWISGSQPTRPQCALQSLVATMYFSYAF